MSRSVRSTLRERAVRLLEDAAQKDRPNVVYHYTSLPAFLGMVTSRQIWCSSVAFANDPAEVTYADDLIKPFVKKVTSGLSDMVAGIDYYAASFSTAHDDLSQWRAYCNNGRGVAIGFDATKMGDTQPDSVLDKVVFCRVLYNLGEQRKLLSAITSLYKAPLANGRVSSREIERLLIDLAVNLALVRGIFKASSYAAEQEWRLVTATHVGSSRHQSQVRFRAAPAAIIPYIAYEFHARRLPLASITVGPCLDGRQTAQSIRAFLLQTGYVETTLARSNVLMRA